MEEIFKKLISFPSVTGDESAAKAITHYVGEFLAERGMHVEYYSNNGFPAMVATTKPATKSPEVMLVAHTDVVPAPRDQFMLMKKDGKYFGRGVFDMKFALASYMQLVDELKDKLHEYDFGIMITNDEEFGGPDGVGYLVNEVGYRCKVAIIPDGGDNWGIETFAKGVAWIELKANGVAAHASRPWEGEHANHKLLDAIEEIRKAFPYTSREGTILSVGVMNGGEAANQTAPEATAMLDVRFGSKEDYETGIPLIEKICQKYDVRTTLGATAAPLVNELSNPYIASFEELIIQTIGYRPDPTFAYGASDGRYFGQHDIPCIIVEPIGGQRHNEGEWLSVEGCEQFAVILTQYIERHARNKVV